MKQPDKQILAILQSFNQKAVLKAFELYTQGIVDNFKKVDNELVEQGWYPQKDKPEGKEFYFINDQYWVQSEDSKNTDIKKILRDIKKSKNTLKKPTKKYTGQKMDLSLVDINCPMCKAAMYKQSVCGGCKEGKQGFKIRLICEDNPDHEILL